MQREILDWGKGRRLFPERHLSTLLSLETETESVKLDQNKMPAVIHKETLRSSMNNKTS